MKISDLNLTNQYAMFRRSARLQNKRDRDDESEVDENQSKKRCIQETTDTDSKIDTAVTTRRKEFQIQNQFVPIPSAASELASSVTAATTTDDALTNGRLTKRDDVTPRDLFLSQSVNRLLNVSFAQRNSPLPHFEWADSNEVWQVMMEKESQYIRDPRALDRHPILQSRMRSILVDWLSEVCEVYRLHRETLHLAVDFVDRYLALTTDARKDCLQLLGISALFVAAKLEEIYPPKLGDFAYVTDGACKESEILEQELLLLKLLKWDLSPMTTNSWLNVFLQLAENMDSDDFVIPQYSAHNFVQLARLVDLCLLDVGSLQFSYSILATAALYHLSSEYVAFSVSGYKWADIEACVHWMAPFSVILRQYGSAELKQFSNIKSSYVHNIQTHSVDLKLLDKVHALVKELSTSEARRSPVLDREFPGLITPPQSAKTKPRCHKSL